MPSPRIRLRFVRFGPSFASHSDPRSGSAPRPHSPEAQILHRNELAVDVGGRAWGYASPHSAHAAVCDLPIIDHHFPRDGQFASAATAVLHYADALWERFADAARSDEGAWIVTHESVDFDALCSAFLAQTFIECDAKPSDVFQIPVPQFSAANPPPAPPKWDWRVKSIPLGPAWDLRHWILRLARYADAVDSCRAIECPRSRTLHGVLYCALDRKRDYQSEPGAAELFCWVRDRLSALPLDPFFDDIWTPDSPFQPELDLLGREAALYPRDLERARKTTVSLPRFSSPALLRQASLAALKQAFLTKEGHVADIHLDPGANDSRDVPAVYLRDPRSQLFKEWVREDGYVFSAIANSAETLSPVNYSKYYFSLNPERADGLHLYRIWSALQIRELNAIGPTTTDRSVGARTDFKGRSGDQPWLWSDPWFDGSHMDWTIVVTPAAGTQIAPPGVLPDLSDDPIVQIVRDCVELHHLAGDLRVWDLDGMTVADHASPTHVLALTAWRNLPPPPTEGFRIVAVAYRPSTNQWSQGLVQLTGEYLWSVLLRGTGQGIPTDFEDRHLVADPECDTVWSRRGFGVAIQGAAQDRLAEIVDLTSRLAVAVAKSKQLLQREQASWKTTAKRSKSDIHDESAYLTELERLIVDLTVLDQQFTHPGRQALRRFAEAIHVRNFAESLRELASARAERGHLEEVKANQTKIEFIEIFVISVYGVEVAKMLLEFWHANESYWIPPVIALALGLMWFGYLVLAPKDAKWRLLLLPWAITVLLILVLIAVWVAASPEAPDVLQKIMPVSPP